MTAALRLTELPPECNRLLEFLRFLAGSYFRARYVFEDADFEGTRAPVIFAANHSGMGFPWDALVLYEELQRRFTGRLVIRPLSAPELLNTPVLSPFALPESWNFISAPATTQHFEKHVAMGESILVNPEGVPGIGKGFNNRYKLQKFSSSFVRMCLKYNRPLVPVSVVNGEYLNPYAYSSERVNAVFRKWINLPFLPLGPTLLAVLIFPFVAYIAMPANLVYVIGRPIDVREYTDKSHDELTLAEFREIAAQIRGRMQAHLDRAVADHGHDPYSWRTLLHEVRRLGWSAVTLFPLTWPVQVHRAFLGDEFSWGRGALSLAICFALCLPVLGWPLLFLLLALAPREGTRNE